VRGQGLEALDELGWRFLEGRAAGHGGECILAR